MLHAVHAVFFRCSDFCGGPFPATLHFIRLCRDRSPPAPAPSLVRSFARFYSRSLELRFAPLCLQRSAGWLLFFLDERQQSRKARQGYASTAPCTTCGVSCNASRPRIRTATYTLSEATPYPSDTTPRGAGDMLFGHHGGMSFGIILHPICRQVAAGGRAQEVSCSSQWLFSGLRGWPFPLLEHPFH